MAEQIYKVRDPTGALREIKGPEGATDDEVIAQAQALFSAPEVSTGKKSVNWANETIATAVDAFPNFPSNVMNLGRAVAGTLAPPVGTPLPQGGVQGQPPLLQPAPDLVRRGMESAGFIKPGMEPVGTGEKFLKAGIQAGVSGLMNPAKVAQVPVNALYSTMGGLTAEGVNQATDNPALATVAGMVFPAAVQNRVNNATAQVRRAGVTQSQNAVKDETLDNARAAGYVVPPSTQNPSFTNNRLESVAGKAAIKQEAGIRNQQITNKLAAEELGFPEGTPITEGKLTSYRDSVSGPYREVVAISPLAAKTLEKLKQARSDATEYHRFYERTADPSALKKAKGFDNNAQLYERVLEKIATRAGKPDLVNELRDARVQIAKSYAIERAMNVGDANISAPALGRMLDKGIPLTGNLKTIASFAEGPGRQFVTEGARIPSPGVSASEMYASAGMGAAGNAIAGPAGLMAAGFPLVRGPMRSMMLSQPYQNTLGTPNYSAGMGANLLSLLPQQRRLDSLLQGLSIGRSFNEEPK